jgi:hypothetical protein
VNAQQKQNSMRKHTAECRQRMKCAGRQAEIPDTPLQCRQVVGKTGNTSPEQSPAQEQKCREW